MVVESLANMFWAVFFGVICALIVLDLMFN